MAFIGILLVYILMIAAFLGMKQQKVIPTFSMALCPHLLHGCDTLSLQQVLYHDFLV